MTASIRSSVSTLTNGGAHNITVELPPVIEDGDLLVVAVMTSNAAAYLTDDGLLGWWSLGGLAVNSRAWKVIARLYDSSDDSASYTLNFGTPAAAKASALALKDHAVSALADIQQGANWTRQENGDSQPLIVAPGVTTVEDDMYILAFTGEATNAAGIYSATTPSDFQMIEDTGETNSIEWITAWGKNQALIGATGDLHLTYDVASANGVGIQYAIPSSETVTEDPAVGNIGLHLSTNVLDTSLVVGFKRLQGSVVRVLANGGNATTAVVDTESDWGYAALTGLNRASLYSITFEVDGVVQTDTQLEVSTRVRPGTPSSYVMVAGSCQFTGSNHPVWDRIVDDNPIHLAHMGDLHYEDATTPAAWRAGVESSMTAPRFQSLLESAIPISWTWDNHDRIILDEGGPGGALNLGTTDPATAAGWKMLAGQNGWASPDTVGTSWVIGRVRYIQTDHWTVRDDPDAGSPSPLTFMGDTQKQWFKNTLTLATEPVIVWLCQWTGQNHANGRWNSYPDESSELEQWIEARPTIKDRMVMIGGDSHSLQVTDGSRTAVQGQRFAGIPNYNISGFNRSGDTGDLKEGWLVNEPLRTSGQSESDWGGYSRITVTDNTSDISLLWEGVRVDPAGLTDVMASQTLTFDTSPPPVAQSTLKWDSVGERRYETGVDHGVLYIPNASGKYTNGYAWNGLVSISESPSGAEGNKQYADNLAYLNLISEEEFSATIEAFSYPNEFGQCDGTAEVVSGIQMGQQARKSFGMSYRTKIGTDLNPDQGYKIHLIYNAMAAPTEKSYATVNDSPEAITFSWELSTTPTTIGEIEGIRYRPTATITVDSTKVDPVALTNLETVLYGTELIPAALPSPAEVVMLLS